MLVLVLSEIIFTKRLHLLYLRFSLFYSNSRDIDLYKHSLLFLGQLGQNFFNLKDLIVIY